MGVCEAVCIVLLLCTAEARQVERQRDSESVCTGVSMRAERLDVERCENVYARLFVCACVRDCELGLLGLPCFRVMIQCEKERERDKMGVYLRVCEARRW